MGNSGAGGWLSLISCDVGLTGTWFLAGCFGIGFGGLIVAELFLHHGIPIRKTPLTRSGKSAVTGFFVAFR